MTTWRVPESLKEQISQLVPDVYGSASEAVVELCKIGLKEITKYKASDSSLSRSLYKEEYWIELELKQNSYANTWVFPKTGYPLVPLSVLELQFNGAVSSDADNCTLQLLVHGQEMLRAGTPFSWVVTGLDVRDKEIVYDPSVPTDTSSFVLRVTASNGYLVPRGTLYARCCRSGPCLS